MIMVGVLVIDVQGNKYTMPEVELGINGFWRAGVINVSYEIFINGS